jgi:thioredoxin reductase (NADPH)
MYDIAIIGAGPAGLAAAITAKARGKSVCVISNPPEESPLAKAQLVENYPGLPKISGARLLELLLAHARETGAVLQTGRVTGVLPLGKYFAISVGAELVEANAVILALGAAQTGSELAGERELLGRGVSYCATCDGMLYRDSVVAVAGTAGNAIEEANFLHSLGATVHFVAPALTEQIKAELQEGIILHLGRAVGIVGGDVGDGGANADSGTAGGVGGAEVATSSASVGGVNATVGGLRVIKENEDGDRQESIIECKAVFLLRPSIAPTALLPTLDVRDGYIATQLNSPTRTSIAGVFAAGDCIGKPLQIAKAVGEGQLAALAAAEYLDLE